ncbi:hypothetical protein A2526_01175 [candidate division WOR-1 bacterium RIFOXYD2_FULL_36_8]|uniref:Transglycosylase SLT domain-containing protein n=1 Tax=candidate division WOR-1 bacterium RIFOXYB2_FULL_36_35 TaxID=1802578 RepID=A0A1F4S472_UNCSA|nr:MAG: hypothetical protein A2230_00820 [candidate division WOR-1 bacterium RIFOXYA2_FULL_36_21]OGC14226.1 MAG: hypothetical protein A2282_06535 [candidate division WOR-1 bacterium RIFOXYA12_FULL_36_13]OGC15231.1 MAG: hypothetical protein A2290_03030 [candidate division WOR-1 bacterium RIFOXYB2_FULL_36_35]OGC38939.1 MAG: hypothetical protein A2526_01175 [candidate division WOR-1 bacterium RIFOXYD2_FULL_36_8]
MADISGLKNSNFHYMPTFWHLSWQKPVEEACSEKNRQKTEEGLNLLHPDQDIPFYPYCHYIKIDASRREEMESSDDYTGTIEMGIASAIDLERNTKGAAIEGHFVAQKYWIPEKYIQMAFDMMPQELVDILKEASQKGKLEEVSENIARLMCILFSFIFDESKFDPDEKNINAVGLFQLELITAKNTYPKIADKNNLTFADLENPEINMMIGFKLILDYFKRFNVEEGEILTAEKFANIDMWGSMGLVTAAYMIGPTKVTKDPDKYRKGGPACQRRRAMAQDYFQFQSPDIIATIQRAFPTQENYNDKIASKPLVSIIQ